MVAIEMSLELRGGGGGRKTFRNAAEGLAVISQDAISFDKLDPIIRKNMLLFLNGIVGAMRAQHGTSWPGGTGPASLSVRSGALLRSIAKSIQVRGKFSFGGEVTGQIGSPLIYASTQEFGATITPKRAKWLTVPLPAALDSRGIMKLPKARDYPRTFVQRSRKGNLIIFQKRGKRKIVPLFVLKKSVTIPPRLNMSNAVEAGSRALGPLIVEETLRAFQQGKL